MDRVLIKSFLSRHALKYLGWLDKKYFIWEFKTQNCVNEAGLFGFEVLFSGQHAHNRKFSPRVSYRKVTHNIDERVRNFLRILDITVTQIIRSGHDDDFLGVDWCGAMEYTPEHMFHSVTSDPTVGPVLKVFEEEGGEPGTR